MVAYSYRRDNGKTSRLSTVLCLIGAISGVWQLGRWTGRRDAQLILPERTLNSADELWVKDEDPTLDPELDHQDLRPSAKFSVPTHGEETRVPAQAKDKLHPDRFWEEYAADRHKMLAQRSGGAGESPPTRYLVFSPADAGLGNHMAGMMSAFVLSLATGRVFLHDWNAGIRMCQASYNDLFVAPFGPWSTAEARGGPISGSFGEVVKGGGDGSGAMWAGEERIASSTERGRCSLDLTKVGIESGAFDRVFVEKRGQDPRPDCLVLYVTTHQYWVDLLSHPAYGAPSVGGTPLSEWLQPDRATATLSAGLFRPVESVRQRIEDTAKSLLPRTGQTLAAHARAYHLGNVQHQRQFVNCIAEWALYKNISTVVMATDIPGFLKGTAETLSPKGIKIVGMDGVQRLGESQKMRDSVDKTQMALAEMMLVGKADVVVTSPRSSFSALAAAMGGASTERIGGMSCKPVENVPEFHFFACGMKWTVNAAKWTRVYGQSFADSNRARCSS